MDRSDKILIKVDFDFLTLDDLVALEEGDRSTRFVRSIIARFVVDPDTKQPFDPDQARKVAGALSVNQAKAVVEEIAKQVEELKDEKLPPISGGN